MEREFSVLHFRLHTMTSGCFCIILFIHSGVCVCVCCRGDGGLGRGLRIYLPIIECVVSQTAVPLTIIIKLNLLTQFCFVLFFSQTLQRFNLIATYFIPSSLSTAYVL